MSARERADRRGGKAPHEQRSVPQHPASGRACVANPRNVPLTPAAVLAAQQSIGNQAVVSLMRSLSVSKTASARTIQRLSDGTKFTRKGLAGDSAKSIAAGYGFHVWKEGEFITLVDLKEAHPQSWDNELHYHLYAPKTTDTDRVVIKGHVVWSKHAGKSNYCDMKITATKNDALTAKRTGHDWTVSVDLKQDVYDIQDPTKRDKYTARVRLKDAATQELPDFLAEVFDLSDDEFALKASELAYA
jgi:hypothetical protein